MRRDIDLIIERMRSEFPITGIQQLNVTHPQADDDGIWFFTHPNCKFEVQIESTYGNCPFLIETTEHQERINATSITEVVEVLTSWLHLKML